MEIQYNHIGNIVPPRASFHDLTNVKKPLNPRRLKIVEPTCVSGVPVYPGTVLEFDISGEGRFHWSALLNCLKAVPVKLNEPLYIAPEPPAPLPQPAQPAPVSVLAAELLRQLASAAATPANPSKKVL